MSGLATGSHACCVFDDDDHKRDVLTAFIAEGLDAGDKVLYFDEHGDDRALRGALTRRHDRVSLLNSGQLVLGDASAAYFEGGVFDGPARAAGFVDVANAALAEGYARVRVYADNGWMPAALDDPEDWLEYELRIGWTVPQHPLIGLCGFHRHDRQVLSATAIDAVHQHRVSRASRPSPFQLYTADRQWVLDGEIDAFGKDLMERLLVGADKTGPIATLDVSGLTFIDAGSAARLRDVLRRHDARAAHPSALIRRVWSALGFEPDLLVP